MSRLKNRNKIRKIVYSWFTLFLLLIIVILLGRGVWNVYKNENVSSYNEERSNEVYRKLEDRSNFLSSEIDALETDKGIETEIRDKFRVVKEGEQLAIIINSGDDEGEPVVVDEESFWIRILNFLRD
jgi:cell division protein FtsB